MSENRRVVVTGIGAITPLGNNVTDTWVGMKNGKNGIAPITLFDTENFKAKLGAEVKGFDPKEYLAVNDVLRTDRYAQFAVAAAQQAVDESSIEGTVKPERFAVIFGTGIGGIGTFETEHAKLMEKGPRRVSPLFVPMMISNMAAGNVSIQFGMKGKCINVVTACATGTHSIGEAFRSIQYGEAEVMVAGGTEASVTPIGVAGFTALTALSTSQDPLRASIPFDKERGGFVMGEGAGVVVLEELEHAKARGAKIYAELVGYGATCDAFHITSPAEDGSGAAKAMEYAMADGGVKPEQIDYVNAHGTGTHHNDLFETKAIKLALGDHAKDVHINSTKSMIGHLLGAAGAVEFITCVKEMEESFVHVTRGLEHPDEELDLDYVQGHGVEMDLEYALSNSLGFGGHNASILIKKYAE